MIPRQWRLNFRYLVTKGLAGCWPVVSLELRAASRRPRTYWFRLAYTAALTLYVAMVWMAVVSFIDVGAYTRSRMAAAGVDIGCGVMWFLVLAGPAVAVLLSANCFHEELHRGGLTLIFSTPLDYAHIVAGKFIGRLAQMQILILAALPPLALVRVFGGVPAAFVVGGVMLGMGCSAVAAALAMLYSVRHDEPYRVVPRAALAACLFNAPAWIAASMGAAQLARGAGGNWPIVWIALAGLQMVLALRILANCTRRLAVRGGVALGSIADEKHRFHNLAGPSGLPEVAEKALARLAWLGRRNPPAAPQAATSQPGSDDGSAPEDAHTHHPRLTHEQILPWTLEIKGSPIIWRAMRRSFMFDRKTRRFAVCAILGYAYFMGSFINALGTAGFQRFMLEIAMAAYIVLLAATSSALICSERQGRCWHLLLTTPLTDWQILWAKVRSAIWEASLPLQIAGLHVAIFTVAGVIPPLAAVYLTMLFVAVTVFVTGLGLLCSCIFQRTAAAMLLCVGTLTGLWVLGPWFAELAERALGEAAGAPVGWSWIGGAANPFCLLWVLLDKASTAGGDYVYRRGGYEAYGSGGWDMSAGNFRSVVASVILAYAVAGAGMAWLAKRTFRRGID